MLSDDDEECPDQIGPYQVLEPLGSGAFATVYKARHRKTMCIVALKAIRKSNLHNMQEFELLEREVSVIKKMDHPFIASFFEILDDDRRFFLAIELVERGNLLDYINAKSGLNESQARRVFYQLITVLDYLHREKHVVHRDLKAENVLLDSHNNIRVVDFGLSRAFTKDNPFLQTTCGSPGYVAPEIIREEPYTAAADIWSAGILLYAMVVGTLPFDGDNLSSMLNAILTEHPVLPPHLSPEVRYLLRKLLTKDPAGRITIVQIMTHPWMAEYTDTKLMSDDHRSVNSLKIQDVSRLDSRVVDEMSSLGYDSSGLLRALHEGQVDERVAVYKMLRRKLLMDEINTWQTARVKRAASKPVKELKMPETIAATQGSGRVVGMLTGINSVIGSRVRKRIIAPTVGPPTSTKLPPLRAPV
jgi:serine/threonine protein kinase